MYQHSLQCFQSSFFYLRKGPSLIFWVNNKSKNWKRWDAKKILKKVTENSRLEIFKACAWNSPCYFAMIFTLLFNVTGFLYRAWNLELQTSLSSMKSRITDNKLPNIYPQFFININLILTFYIYAAHQYLRVGNEAFKALI